MEEKQEKNVEKKTFEKLKEKIENVIDKIIEEDSIVQNIAMLCQLQDIHKNIENEEYWKEKIDNMYNEGSYGRYNEGYNARGVPGTGKYRDGSYSRRGVPGSGRRRYREGEDMMEEMKYSYGAYSDGNEYGENYRGEGTKELEKMLDYNIMLIEHLKKNAKNQEERQVIEQKQRELSEI